MSFLSNIVKKKQAQLSYFSAVLTDKTLHVGWFDAADVFQYESVPLLPNTNPWQTLPPILQHSPCILTLVESQYHWLTVDKPPASSPAAWMTELHWQVKDLVDLPITSIHLDYIDAPTMAGVDKVHVVVVNKLWLQAVVQAAQQAGIVMCAVAPDVLTFRHPTSVSAPASDMRLLMLGLEGQNWLLSVYHQQHLLTFRRLSGFQVKAATLESDAAMEMLSVEVQRFMDFVESQLRTPTIKQIELIADGHSVETQASLQPHFEAPVALMSTSQVILDLLQSSIHAFKLDTTATGQS
ncbi:MAG: hypothetical protein ISP86_00915 [Shewanellaceae bacterium]|nr:hypothetical protein [Shewanellaceae bacterium]